MPILGIDPGIAITGYGLIDLDPAGNPIPVKFGVIDTTAVKGTSSRLLFLYEAMMQLLADYNPTSCGLEKLFFSKNVTTAMAVSEARGVVRLCQSSLAYLWSNIHRTKSNRLSLRVAGQTKARCS